MGAERICPVCLDRERARSSSGSRPIAAPVIESDDTHFQITTAPAAGSRFGNIISEWRAESLEWCRGRSWVVRLPLWLYFVYTLSRHLGGTEPYRSIFDGINLGIHELGHVIFRPFGEFLTIAGGTIAQCLAPIAAGIVFHRQRDFFAITVAVCWLATNLWGVAVYVGDARALALPLVAPGMGMMPAGDGPILHDWNHLLGVTGLLRHDQTIAFFLRGAALAVMSLGLAGGAWLMVQMAFAKKRF